MHSIISPEMYAWGSLASKKIASPDLSVQWFNIKQPQKRPMSFGNWASSLWIRSAKVSPNRAGSDLVFLTMLAAKGSNLDSGLFITRLNTFCSSFFLPATSAEAIPEWNSSVTSAPTSSLNSGIFCNSSSICARGLNPQNASKSVIATAISGLWLSSG
ncbi:hypothetical protein OGAPHI_003087 [Ogataea philodendri]|uniref:Uncharacterized protein n=1 Tax=Ogataea philodendri TaxID=1378263 RepID=A0A9P8P8C6_9ASCO|nr:uncharacterized protein OGAPHI_003087 [Ogataea philodendri]KAH3667438.1 hypothetical protein OGAPHI_003087 [Ogataea philodendri]